MGMGYAPDSGWIIGIVGLTMICPTEVAAIEALFAKHGYSWDDFAADHEIDDQRLDDEATKAVDDAWQRLVTAFAVIQQ